MIRIEIFCTKKNDEGIIERLGAALYNSDNKKSTSNYYFKKQLIDLVNSLKEEGEEVIIQTAEYHNAVRIINNSFLRTLDDGKEEDNLDEVKNCSKVFLIDKVTSLVSSSLER